MLLCRMDTENRKKPRAGVLHCWGRVAELRSAPILFGLGGLRVCTLAPDRFVCQIVIEKETDGPTTTQNQRESYLGRRQK